MIKNKPKQSPKKQAHPQNNSDNDFESEYDESEVIEKVKDIGDLDEASHDKRICCHSKLRGNDDEYGRALWRFITSINAFRVLDKAKCRRAYIESISRS